MSASVPDPAPLITVLVINRGRRDLVDRCLRSVAAAVAELPGPAETIVIDNASDDGSAEMIAAEHPEVRLIALDFNAGFAPAVVQATALAQGAWLALVNNDAWLEPDTLARLYAAGESAPDVGASTAQVRFADRPGVINTAGLEIDQLAVAYDLGAGGPAQDTGASWIEVFGASGCVTLYRLAMLEAIGGFDASFFAFGEDADVAWRARMAHWRCLYVPGALAHHHGSATAGERSDFKYRLVGRNRVRMIAKNATTAQLLRWAWAMVLYDLAYVSYALVVDRSLAPLSGRIEGLLDWRRYRAAGAAQRRPAALAGAGGWRKALAMRRAYDAREG